MKKVTLLVFLTFLIVSCGENNQQISRNDILTSFQKIQSATKIGISQNEYRKLLIESQNLLDRHKRKFQNDSSIKPLDSLLKIYTDALLMWELDRYIYFERMNETEKNLVETYNLKKYADKSVNNEAAVKIIWKHADLMLAAEDVLNETTLSR